MRDSERPPARYWHGGICGHRVGDVITDDIAVEVTTDRDWGRMRAAVTHGGGALYRVEPLPMVAEFGQDGKVAYCPSAKVLAVYEGYVKPSKRDLRRWHKIIADHAPKHRADDA